MRKLMQKSIQSRNEQAIQKLAQLESTREWAKTTPPLSIADRAKYFISLGEQYAKRNT